MEKSSRVFFLIISVLVTGSILVAYYRFFVVRDYMIQAETECDPSTETCFVYVCDPLGEEDCTGDPLEDTSYYKLVDRLAVNMPSCDRDEETCLIPSCSPDETRCSYTLCDSITAEEGEICNDPNEYIKGHSVREEGFDSETDKTGGGTVLNDIGNGP